MKESLLLGEELAKKKEKLEKIKGKRSKLVKEQHELESKREQLAEELKDLEARIAAGRRGEEVQVDVSYPDLLGDQSGIGTFLQNSFDENKFIEDFDVSLFDDIPVWNSHLNAMANVSLPVSFEVLMYLEFLE